MPTVNLLTVKDGIEILFFCSCVYYFLRWLQIDRQKKLLLYFYGYAATAFVAHYTGLFMISQLLFFASPVVICIMITLHQKSLQKNFLAFQKIAPAQQSGHDWIEELMRASLAAMNTSRSIIWLIERKDHLEALLEAPTLLYAHLKKDLVDLLLEQDKRENIIWIHETGKLIAGDASFNFHLQEELIHNDYEAMPTSLQAALFLSSRTDALVIQSCPVSRTFTLIGQERMVDKLSAHHMSLILHKLFVQKTTFTEGIQYAPQTSRASAEQRRH